MIDRWIKCGGGQSDSSPDVWTLTSHLSLLSILKLAMANESWSLNHLSCTRLATSQLKHFWNIMVSKIASIEK